MYCLLLWACLACVPVASDVCDSDDLFVSMQMGPVLVQKLEEYSNNGVHVEANNVNRTSHCGAHCDDSGVELPQVRTARWFDAPTFFSLRAKLSRGKPSTSMALLLAITSMLFWGSWANTLLMAKTRFELFFLNYMVGNGIAAVLMASFVERPNFACPPPGCTTSFMLSLIAGAFYAGGSILMTNALDLAGMSLVVPVVMGMEFALGTPLMLLVEGFGVPAHWALSLAGVATVLVAMILDSISHDRLVAEATEKLDEVHDTGDVAEQPNPHGSPPTYHRSQTLPSFQRSATRQPRMLTRSMTLPNVSSKILKGRLMRSSTGWAPTLPLRTEDERSIEGDTENGRFGFALAVIAGLLFALWPCLASIAEGNCMGLLHRPNTLSFSTFYMLFVGSACVFSICTLPILSQHPIGPVDSMDFWRSYIQQNISAHALGILGGVIQGLGTLLSLQSGSVLGNTVSMSITRCAPVVAAMWGWCYWGELHGASFVTRCIFCSMMMTFLVAVALLGWASSFK